MPLLEFVLDLLPSVEQTGVSGNFANTVKICFWAIFTGRVFDSLCSMLRNVTARCYDHGQM